VMLFKTNMKNEYMYRCSSSGCDWCNFCLIFRSIASFRVFWWDREMQKSSAQDAIVQALQK
jgi:hypothetical protein